jgi:hypothetical protein
MSDPIIEKVGSRESTTGQSPSVKMSWLVWGSEDEPIVRDLVKATAPLYYASTKIRRLRTHQVHLGGGVWNADADYGLVPRHNDGNSGDKPGKGDQIGPEISLDISAATQHITQSLSTPQSAKLIADPDAIPLFNGAIGVSKEGGRVTVKGCDIPVPQGAWTETWTFNAQYVTWQYFDDVTNLVGRNNIATFRTWPAGEVMFMGMNSTPFGDDQRKCVFSFKRAPNVTGFVLLPGWQSVGKTGWQYMWVNYVQKADPGSNSLITVPKNLYVEEVGRPGDSNTSGNQTSFAKLLIGA